MVAAASPISIAAPVTSRAGDAREATLHAGDVRETAPVLLAPGTFLVELETTSTCTPETLTAGLRELGFRKAAIDHAPRKGILVSPLRFVAQLGDPLETRDTSLVRWGYIRRLAIDPFATLRARHPDRAVNHVEPTELCPERVYEARFLLPMLLIRGAKQRERYARELDPARAMAVEKLAEMGFETERLVAMHRDVRLPSADQTSNVLWCGLLRWTGPSSIVTEDDSFFFDDLRPVTT